MTQDEIIRMAVECQLLNASNREGLYAQALERFADLVAAHERETCAKVCEEIEQDRWNLYKGRPPYTGSESGRADPHEQGVSMGAGECAAAIRAIKFEGDTGFRPVSEMIAEHKQDPKKAAAIEKAHTPYCKQAPMCKTPCGNSDCVEQPEQEPVARYYGEKLVKGSRVFELIDRNLAPDTPLYAAPVPTKDLTDSEIRAVLDKHCGDGLMAIAYAVIAADRELNDAK